MADTAGKEPYKNEKVSLNQKKKRSSSNKKPTKKTGSYPLAKKSFSVTPSITVALHSSVDSFLGTNSAQGSIVREESFIRSKEELDVLSLNEIYEYIINLQYTITTLQEISNKKKKNSKSRPEQKLPKLQQDFDVTSPTRDDISEEDQSLQSFFKKEESKSKIPASSRLQGFVSRKSISVMNLRSSVSDEIVSVESNPAMTRQNSKTLPDGFSDKVDIGVPQVPKKVMDEWVMLPDLVMSCIGFRIESGNSRVNPENFMQYNRYYYAEFFQDNKHINLVNRDLTCIVSISKEAFHYRMLIRTKKGDCHHLVDRTKLGKVNPKTFPGKLMKIVAPEFSSCRWLNIIGEEIRTDLLDLEQKMIHKQFKVGILLAKDGQRTEEEMFSNTSGSPAYEEFLDFIGERKELKKWNGFSGGLDTKTGTTGKDFITSHYKTNDIIFHVSTLLPFTHEDPQQVERKRHLGNDIVIIIFLDGQTPYKPTLISSNFIHIAIIVQPLTNEDGITTHYRIWSVQRDTVNDFAPPIPRPPIFERCATTREFLYKKIINAELACHQSPEFAIKLQNTRSVYLKEIAMKYKSMNTKDLLL